MTTNTKTLQKVAQRWSIYFNDTKDATTMVNLAHIDIGPMKNKPNLAKVTIKMNNPRDTGFSSTVEDGIFIDMDIENAIKNQENATDNSIQVARHTGGGHWILYFYCNDTDSFTDSVNNVMAGFTDYQYDVEFQEDKVWDVYLRSLFPTEWQFHTMSNRAIVNQLLKMGDDLSQPREVDHTLFFKSKAGRKGFLKKAKKLGFTVNAKFTENSMKERPFGLVVSRVDKVDWVSVDEYVQKLWKLSKQHKGFYDGWATWSGKGASPSPVGVLNDVEDSQS